jgi:hypothetical protein
LDAIFGECSSILELLSIEDKTLLIRRYSLQNLDLFFDTCDALVGMHFKSDCFASESFDKNLERQVKRRSISDVVK